MNATNILRPAARRLLTLTTLSVLSFAHAQEAPATQTLPAQTPVPTGAPAAAPAASTASTDRILPLADPSTPTGATLGGVLSGNSTAVATIQRQELTQRDKLLAEIADRIQIADRRIAELQQSSKSALDADRQKALEKALADYNQTKAKLQQTLDASRAAELNTWERVRSSLASDYAFFVAAAAGVELASPIG